MKSGFAAVLWVVSVSGNAFAATAPAPTPTPAPATAPAPEVHIFPEAVFAKESTAVMVTANTHLAPGQPAPKLSVVEVDARGNRVRYIGILSDDGVMGDRIANDGIFTRKFEVSEKSRPELYYAVVTDDEAMKPRPVAWSGARASSVGDPVPPLQLHVIRRPSFIEMVGEAWHKIRAGLRKSVQS